MVYKEQLVIALVLKELGIELPDAVLAEKVVSAQLVVEALLDPRTLQRSKEAELQIPAD